MFNCKNHQIKYNKYNKAQIAVTDLFVAIFIFIALLISIFVTWNIYITRIEQRDNYNNILSNAVQITDTLVKSPGKPINWEQNNATAEIIGLASSDRNLSERKVNAFVTLTYNTTKDLLNIKRYDFKFTLININNSALIEYGLNSTGNNTVSIRRIVWYGNATAFMDFKLWK